MGRSLIGTGLGAMMMGQLLTGGVGGFLFDYFVLRMGFWINPPLRFITIIIIFYLLVST